MLLKELIAYLEKRDAATILSHGFTRPHSWRGDYSQLAFEPKEQVSVGGMLAAARSALGKTYEGYKGGSYTMGEYTDVYLAEYGSTGEPLSRLTLDAMFLISAYTKLVKALEEIEAHHVTQNAIKGRDEQRSTTLRIARAALKLARSE